MGFSRGRGPVDAQSADVRIVQGDLPTKLAATLGRADRIAWDVETTGLDWRQERLATCQLFADGIGVVVVQLEDSLPSRIVELLANPAVEKVFHHAPFDLRFMVHAWGVEPARIRCTKVASKILAPNAANETHSLQQLVAHALGVRLTKGSVRTSDWAAASLTPEQVGYAAGDVLYLLPLLDVLQADLEKRRLGRLYDNCCTFLPARVRLELGGYPDVFAY
jgi:ribonuclease D